MKKNLLYNFLLLSLAIHLLPGLAGLAYYGSAARHDTAPITVDITGPVCAAPKEPQRPAPETETLPPKPAEPSPEAIQTEQPKPSPEPVAEGKSESAPAGASPADKQGASECTRGLVNRRDMFIDAYLTRLSPLMDMQADGLIRVPGPRQTDPTVEFTVKSGELDSIAIVRSSGNEELDRAVLQAVAESCRFIVMPDIFRDQNFTFVATINIF